MTQKQQAEQSADRAIIDRVEIHVLRLPFHRLQRFARLDAYHQTSLFVRITDTDGATGVGEAIVPCGPWWSGDSVESMRATLDTYLVPAMIGQDATAVSAMMADLNTIARDNRFAKSAIEIACHDLVGRKLGVPVHVLLGGRRRDRILNAWPLASGDPEKDRDEIEMMLAEGKAGAFKVKAGAYSLTDDLRRIEALARVIDGRAGLRVDPNESWSEVHALRAMDTLADLGVELIEQPVPREQSNAMARIAARSRLPVMVDEGQQTEADILHVIEQAAAHVVSIKLMKSGGLRPAQRAADMAHAAGISLYMGTFLETGVGLAAGMQLAASLPDLPFGGELFTGLLLQDDILATPLVYREGHLELPAGPGLGIDIDEHKLRHYSKEPA